MYKEVKSLISNKFLLIFTYTFFVQSPGSGRLHEDDTNFIGEENFEKKSNFIKESIVDLSRK